MMKTSLGERLFLLSHETFRLKVESVRRPVAAAAAAAIVGLLGACASTPDASPDFAATPFEPWTEAAQEYRLYPGDVVEMTVHTAQGLSRALTVAPDGRIHPPLTDAVMAAGRTLAEVEGDVLKGLDKELREPKVSLRPAGFGSQRVFVGGQVRNPGVYEIPGQIGVLEAVMLAGGFTEGSDMGRVSVLRRGSDGGTMLRVVDLAGAPRDGSVADTSKLVRHDIVYVPRSGIAQWNLAMRQYLRDALPVSFGLYYDLNSN